MKKQTQSQVQKQLTTQAIARTISIIKKIRRAISLMNKGIKLFKMLHRDDANAPANTQLPPAIKCESSADSINVSPQAQQQVQIQAIAQMDRPPSSANFAFAPDPILWTILAIAVLIRKVN